MYPGTCDSFPVTVTLLSRKTAGTPFLRIIQNPMESEGDKILCSAFVEQPKRKKIKISLKTPEKRVASPTKTPETVPEETALTSPEKRIASTPETPNLIAPEETQPPLYEEKNSLVPFIPALSQLQPFASQLDRIREETAQNQMKFQLNMQTSILAFQAGITGAIRSAMDTFGERMNTLEQRVKDCQKTGIHQFGLAQCALSRQALWCLFENGFNMSAGEVMGMPYFTHDESLVNANAIINGMNLVIFLPLLCVCLKEWFGVTTKITLLKESLSKCFNVVNNVPASVLQQAAVYLGLAGALKKPSAGKTLGSPQTPKFIVIQVKEFQEAIHWFVESIQSHQLAIPLGSRIRDENNLPVQLKLKTRNCPVFGNYSNLKPSLPVLSFNKSPCFESLKFITHPTSGNPWFFLASVMEGVNKLRGASWPSSASDLESKSLVLLGKFCMPQTQQLMGLDQILGDQNESEEEVVKKKSSKKRKRSETPPLKLRSKKQQSRVVKELSDEEEGEIEED